MELGLEPERFWHITPREMAREIKGKVAFFARQHAENAWLAWHVAALSRMKRLPPLSKLTGLKPAASPKQSPDVLFAGMKAIFLAFGGKPEELEK